MTDISNGAHNLLVNCVGLKAGEDFLLVEEDPRERFYSPELANALAVQVQALGARVSRITAEVSNEPTHFFRAVADGMSRVDHTVFVHRIADYCRFQPLPGQCSKTICYARDLETLNSRFAGTSHALMTRLLARLEQELLSATTWRITCPLATDISGTFCWSSLAGGEDDEFSVSLFPVTTFKPVSCENANGTVKLSRWLMAGGAAKVEPSTLSFDEVVSVTVSNGMVSAIDGPAPSAQSVIDHYDHVARTLGICRDRVHSWHAGINPHTFYAGSADDDLERWGAVSFGSPRYLHFHTCGDTPPGEIAWSVFNPTVWIDGERYWKDGEFVWLRRSDNRTLIDQYPGAGDLLEASADIGI